MLHEFSNIMAMASNGSHFLSFSVIDPFHFTGEANFRHTDACHAHHLLPWDQQIAFPTVILGPTLMKLEN